MITVLGVEGLPEVQAGDELADLILARATLADLDALVVTQKIVSKAEGRVVQVDPDDASERRRLVLAESTRVLRQRGDLVISETRHGFVCANAGVDFSNMPHGRAALLPIDPDRSARHLRDALQARTALRLGVVISDTFGRAWRQGLTDVAIGVAGLAAIVDLRGQHDALGRKLVATEICVADEVASAADLVKGKSSATPVAIVRGLPEEWFRESSARQELVRPYGQDLFR